MPGTTNVPLVEKVQAAVGVGYRIERELGQGGMAVVFLGRDVRHGRDVAVKVLRPEIAAALSPDRFLREIRIAAGLQHPLILPLFDSGESNGLFYYVMPFVEGESLRDRLRREARIPAAEAATVGREIAEALHYAHERGFVHRDIKPENILLSGGHPLVADFGIARALGGNQAGRLTETGISIGTPHYMSPEQALGESTVDRRSDIYSLACVIYEMLTGGPPFTGPSLQAVVARHIQAQVPLASKITKTVPRQLSEAVAIGLAKDPNDRYQTALQFAAALSGDAAGLRRRRDRSGLVRAGLTVAVGAALTAGGALIWRQTQRAPVANRDLVAIAPFNIRGAGLGFSGEQASERLASNLNGAGPLRTVAPTEIIRRWQGLADEASADQAARRTGAGLAVFGSVERSARDSARLTATIRDVIARVNLADIEVKGRADRIDLVIDSATVALVEALSRKRPIGAVLMATARTRSLPAMKEYLKGEQFYRRAAWDSARGYYERAAELDTGFAQALHRIYQARSAQGTGNDSLILRYGFRAGLLNHGLTIRDSLMIDADFRLVGFFFRWPLNEREAFGGVLASLEQAAQRFPDDPEIWYQLGAVRERVGWQTGVGAKEVLEALDRSIALDSAFAPAYVKALTLVLAERGETAARNLVRRFLALKPLGTGAEAAVLTAHLLDGHSVQSPETQKMLATAPVLTLSATLNALGRWRDSGEVAIELSRQLAQRARDPHLAGDRVMAQRLLVRSLAWRGRLAEVAGPLAVAPDPYLFAQLAVLGSIPVTQAAETYSSQLAAAGSSVRQWQALPWWAARGDSISLLQVWASRRRGDPSDFDSRYVRDASLAYLDLVRGDSARALGRFLALPLVEAGFDAIHQRLVTVQLLRLAGRYREALSRVAAEPRSDYPFDAFWPMERARASEQLGLTDAAIAAYSETAAIWVHADDLLQPMVTEAKAAVRRLRPRAP